ncbi:MAG: ferritin-like domain-containing protein [Cyanobacteriota bacterium]
MVKARIYSYLLKLGLRDKQRLLRLLAKIEFGVAIFCFKLQRQAIAESKHNLASMLEAHGREESKHGKMLASLADGWERISLTETGQWVAMFRPSGEQIAKPIIDNPTTIKTITWDSIKFPGERLIGLFENFDGISKRYFSARVLFKNRDAADYPWEDKLAFMYVLEEETAKLYSEMSRLDDPKISAIAQQVTEDEFNHANYLKRSLAEFSPLPEAAIDKWRNRVWWARWGLVVDLIRFLMKA